MIMNERKVSVVIPVYGLQLGIINTIESLQKQTFQPEEIIIVSDQENEDGIKFMENYIKSYVSKKFSHQRVNVRVISRLGRRGLSSARNLGAHVASGNIIAYIDSDAIASPCWLENLLKGYNTSENIGGVGGPIKPTKNITRFQELVFKALKQPGVIYEGGKVISIAGGNASYLKELCLRIKWDESVMWGNEDNDFNFRLLKEGYKLACAEDAIIYHEPRKNLLEYMRWRYEIGKTL
jgi:glycosyltransferase involved in cell wall biosynthesis